MFGWSGQEVVGRPLPVVPQEEEMGYRQTREVLLRGEVPPRKRISPRRRDGSRFPALVCTAPLRDEAGRMSGSLHIFQALEDAPDWRITEELRMEAIERLGRTIAHEFNNSVGAILGWAEMALEGLEPRSSLRKPLNHILKEARHASAVIRDLAVLSRRQGLEMDPVDLNHIVEQALDLIHGALPPSIVVDMRLAPRLPRILADAQHIARVLTDLCLLSRAEVRGVLRIETRQSRLDSDACRGLAGATPGNYLVLGISYGGMRVKAETLERLFEPFPIAPRDGVGSGLGLAVVHGIVRQHGGFISVSATPNREASLQVYLPEAGTQADLAR
jgi:signal transduction histidine kinase